jgi:uncharacterized MAPEG superfamily protein
MTIEMYAVVATALLLLVLAFVSAALYGAQVGNPALMGNREGIAAPVGAAGRAQRAHRNLLENAVPFAAVAICGAVAGESTQLTQWAALAFVAARLLHAAAYLAGVPGIRTFAWLAGVVATGAIAFAITF